MGAAFDAVSTLKDTLTSGSWAHTPVGVPTYALVCITLPTSTSASYAATYGGVAMSFLAKAECNSGGQIINGYVFGLKDPPAGAQTVAISWDGANRNFRGSCVTVTGANVLNAVNAAVGQSAAPSVTVNSRALDVVIDFVSAYNSGVGTPGAGQTKRQDWINWPNCLVSDEAGGASNTAMTWSCTSCQWATIAVSISPAAGYPQVLMF